MTDAVAQTVVTVPRRRPLKTVRHVSRELARLYWEMREGAIEPALGGRLTFALMSLSRILETVDIEARLVALESNDQGHP